MAYNLLSLSCHIMMLANGGVFTCSIGDILKTDIDGFPALFSFSSTKRQTSGKKKKSLTFS